MLNIPVPENIAIKLDHVDALLIAIVDRIDAGLDSDVTERLALAAMDINATASKDFDEYIKSVVPVIDAAAELQGVSHE